MSRTRIVKGKITEIIGKDYNIYSESSIIDNAVGVISDKGVAKGESYGSPEKPSAGEINAKCMVQFRPHTNWDGEYGFDWIRTGDTGQIGDKKWYRDIIGKYVYTTDVTGEIDYCNPKFINQVNAYDRLVNEFKKYTVPWKNAGSHPFYYIVPYLSLLPKKSATLNLKVEVLEEPDSFDLKFNADYLDVKFKNSLSVKSGVREMHGGLEIYCKKEFNIDQIIEIIAIKGEQSHPVGQLIVVKNGKAHRTEIKVTLVKVVNRNKSVKLDGEIDSLKKILNQSYTNLIYQHTTLEIHPNFDISAKFLENSDELYNYLDAELRRAKNSKGQVNKSFFDKTFRLYYLPETCEGLDCGGGFYLGESQKLPKNPVLKDGNKSSIIIFNLTKTAAMTTSKLLNNKTTAGHELFHAIGLNHTFDNDSKYVYKKFETDNIMDYSSRTSKIIPKQTYKWQWDLIKKQLK